MPVGLDLVGGRAGSAQTTPWAETTGMGNGAGMGWDALRGGSSPLLLLQELSPGPPRPLPWPCPTERAGEGAWSRDSPRRGGFYYSSNDVETQHYIMKPAKGRNLGREGKSPGQSQRGTAHVLSFSGTMAQRTPASPVSRRWEQLHFVQMETF